MLFEVQVDFMTIKEIMSHDDLKTTMQAYAHYTETM